ncbi:BppU family phage baseplate upper protein [Enterococcus avium]|uniref:BppU family phage baseplate upper protein n=1 Tax=Enterococcus avium TaxID=33945 RepID=UPI003DA55779
MSDVLRFDLAKDPKGNPITYGRVGDSNGLTRRVKVFEDGKPLDLTGWATTFEGNTSNWKTKVFDTEGINIIDATKGEFSYTFPNMAFAVEGQYERAYFSFMKGDQRKSTGNFEIIVLGDSDIDAPEAETIITEYNKLVAELNELQNQAISELNEQQNQAIDEMNRNFTEAQGRISELEVQINDLRNKIDQALTDFENGNFWTKEESFNKEESSANVIYQVIGKEKAEITFRLDAKSEFVKVSSVGYTTLLSPTNVSWIPLTEEQLNNLSSLDGSLYSARDVAANYMKQLKYDCDILGFFKSLLGEKFFTIRGATTDSQKVEVLESLITDFTSNVYGYGSGGGINKLTHRNWNGTWTVSDSTAANEVTRIGQTIESTDTNWKKLINGGKISVLSNSEPTISPNYSTVNIDYLCLDVTIELSANEHFEYMIAANHVENLATQAEAETGLNDSKTMTPLRVIQAIAKWATNKFVSLAGNETILGIKNFTGGLLANNKRVLTVDDITQSSGTVTLVNGNTGSLKYTKQLNSVTLTFNVLNGRGGGTPNGSLIATLPDELAPASYFEHLIGSTDRSSLNTAMISIGTNKEIRWQRNSSTASDYSFEVTYQTN